ncbi:YrzE family protein [Bartonella sp. F02]|uniref:YrzE family protein n=1 Tax=Bartonella sp. F02 TaxID=2967262 RepID=UPI0022A9AA5B|nr:YrzE family protein [Bartonella sp. F02]MCZ2328764.1 YrzE family protein [Bartonella sp. F02]
METRLPTDTSLDTLFLKETALETQYSPFRTTISWSAVFAGLLTTIATAICFSFFVAALGLGQVDLYSSSPFGSIFTSVGLGSFIVIVLSLAAGGFVAGRFAETAGSLHGFLTWAILMLLITVQATLLVSSAAHISANAISKTASVLETEGRTILATTNSKTFDKLLPDQNNYFVDFDKLRNDLQTVLQKSKIPALDPEHLNRTYKEAIKDIRSTITAFREDPSHYRTHLKNLENKLSNRVQNITTQINRNDIIQGLMNNGMTHAEAKITADNAIDIYQTAEAKTEQAIKSLSQQTGIIANNFEKAFNKAQNMTNQAIGTASSIGWWSFFGSFLGAIIASFGGYYGYKSRQNYLIL